MATKPKEWEEAGKFRKVGQLLRYNNTECTQWSINIDLEMWYTDLKFYKHDIPKSEFYSAKLGA